MYKPPPQKSTKPQALRFPCALFPVSRPSPSGFFDSRSALAQNDRIAAFPRRRDEHCSSANVSVSTRAATQNRASPAVRALAQTCCARLPKPAAPARAQTCAYILCLSARISTKYVREKIFFKNRKKMLAFHARLCYHSRAWFVKTHTAEPCATRQGSDPGRGFGPGGTQTV